MHIEIRKKSELNMLKQVNPYMAEYKIPRELLEHVKNILGKNDLGRDGYVAILMNPIRYEDADIMDELNLNSQEVDIPDNNSFYIIIKGKKHPMKKKKRWYSYDIVLPKNNGRIYAIYCMSEERLKELGVL